MNKKISVAAGCLAFSLICIPALCSKAFAEEAEAGNSNQTVIQSNLTVSDNSDFQNPNDESKEIEKFSVQKNEDGLENSDVSISPKDNNESEIVSGIDMLTSTNTQPVKAASAVADAQAPYFPDVEICHTVYSLKNYISQIETIKTQNPDYADQADNLIQKAEEKLSLLETIDILRLYNPNSGEHFYTTDADERDHLVSVGWKFEGVGWNSYHAIYEEDKVNESPLYREYNPNAFAANHNYTTSQNEN